jgi:hypothetical protein
MRLFLSLAVVLSFSVSGFASHIIGGSITWERTNSNQYIFTLEIVRNCANIQGPVSRTVNGPTGAIQLNRNNALGGSYNLGNCYSGACASGSGFESLVYTSSPVTLTGPIPAAGWEFSHSFCCINSPNENTSAGHSDQLGEDFSVYPNPVQDWLEISLVNNDKKEFTLYNLQGQKLMQFIVSGGRNRIELSSLAKGAYLLKSGGKQVRFVKD